MIHSAGNQVLLTLVLGKVCGVNVDEKTLLGALTALVSLCRPWCHPGGRPAPLARLPVRRARRGEAAVMHVASGAKGNTTIYRKAKEAFAIPRSPAGRQRICLGKSTGKA